MFYTRKIYPELLAHSELPAVTVLTGMRRTGKTTLVMQILADIPNKNSLYLDLQRPANSLNKKIMKRSGTRLWPADYYRINKW